MRELLAATPSNMTIHPAAETTLRPRMHLHSRAFACTMSLLLALGAHAAADVATTYFFADFEAATGWAIGPLPERNSSVRAMQGKAQIVEMEEGASRQVLALDPSAKYAAVQVDAAPFAGSKVVFCEVLARPAVVDEQRDEEFLDFGGAILGCFRVGQQGEIRGLYAKSPQENVWISTGIRFDLGPDGRPAKWLRISIRSDLVSRTWSVTINGTPAVVALRTVALNGESALPLWLYGSAESVSEFDDVLISTTVPEELEKILARPVRAGVFEAARPGRQLVTQEKPTAELRRTQPAINAPKSSGSETSPLTILGWHLTLDTGRQKIEKPLYETKNAPGIIAYAPASDDDGRPLPQTLTITADAVLKPGTDLSRLRWRVAELKGYPDKIGEIAGQGDFRSGLVQTFKFTPEWARKATQD